MKIGVDLLSIVAFFLAACGGDSGTGSGPAQAETIYGLGECEASNEGVTKFVTSENQYYKCVNGDWEETETPVQSSSSKKAPFAGSSSSNMAFPGLDTKSSASFGFLSTDSKSGYDPIKQTLTDSRDGQTYRTTKIGDQVWMAENLNYRYLGPTAKFDSSSFCYDDDPANCDKYGRLYLWSAAMDSAGIIAGNAANGCGSYSECVHDGTVRGVCPSGWHLPDATEWKALFDAVGGKDIAGARLKSTSDWDWCEVCDKSRNGTDAYSFSALPAGWQYFGDGGRDIGASAIFLSSSAIIRDNTTFIVWIGRDDTAGFGYQGATYAGFSVRCLKD